MRRAGPQERLLLPFAVLAVLACAGCGKSQESQSALSFETLADTSGLTTGRAIVDSLVTVRMDGGALRVHGGAELPDGTRLRVAVRQPGEPATLAMAEVEVEGRRFESPPLVGESGPLAPGRYLVEVTARFTTESQSQAVLRATGGGRSLRGPGITRDRNGDAMFFLSQEIPR